MAVQFPDRFPVPQAVDPVEVHINRFFNHVVACANHRRDTLLIAAHEKREEMAERVRERAQSEQQLIAARADIERHLRENLLQSMQERILAEIEEKLSLVRVLVPETRVVFRGECEQLEQLIEGVGEIVEEEVPVVPRYLQMRPTVAVAKQGKAPGELWSPLSVAIDQATNHIYVAEGGMSPKFTRMSIFSETGEYLKSYTHEHMEALNGIAIHDNNLYVTDWKVHAVFHIKIEADFRLVARLGSIGSDIGQFNLPHQLSISSNGDLFIADLGNDRIQILDNSLHPIREVAHPSMHEPRDVKLTTDEMYVLSRSDTLCVHIFSKTGYKIRSLLTCGDGMQLTNPFHFCLDAHKSLIISDFKANQIKIFSKEGTLLHSLGKQGQEVGMFASPTGLALTSNRKLVTVSWGDNYRLQIFSSL